jgi:hypothetical protein
MRSSVLAITCAGLVLGASQAGAQQWTDHFDSYTVPGTLAAQGTWEEWDGSVGVDPDVVNSLSLTPDNCVLITGQPAGGGSGDDVIYNFDNIKGGQPTSGSYVAYARTWVPDNATGTGWFIMLNRYPALKNWSVQIHFDANNGLVHAAEPVGTDLPLVTGQWMPLITCIDLDNDRVDIFYGSDLLCENQPWIGNGNQQIACIDLYGGEPAGGGITELYYENVSLEKVNAGGPLSLVSSPAPLADGGTITFDIEGPTLPSGTAALALTSISGTPTFSVLAILPLDGNGETSVTGGLPTGLAGVQLGFVAFASGGGPLAKSNTELVVIQ